MKKYFLDTSVYLRFILKDEPRLARRAQKYLLAAQKGEIELILVPEILAEINYVLQKVYLLSREEIIQHLSALGKTPYIEVIDRSQTIEAIKLYRQTGVGFVDCLLFVRAKNQRAEVLSFDKDFEKLKKVVDEY